MCVCVCVCVRVCVAAKLSLVIIWVGRGVGGGGTVGIWNTVIPEIQSPWCAMHLSNKFSSLFLYIYIYIYIYVAYPTVFIAHELG